jgi:hypothetical protein
MRKNKASKVSFISTMPKNIDTFPHPEPAYKSIPAWYKKIDSFYDNNSTPINGVQQITVKRCIAFLDMLSSGYIIKAPFDIYIDTTDGKEEFVIPQAMQGLQDIGRTAFTGTHSMKQLEGYPIDLSQYINNLFRVNPIWVVKTEKGVSSLFIQPQHQELSPLYAVSGVIDTDGYPSDGLLSFFVKKDFKGYVKRGTPLVQVIPFVRTDFESEVILDEKESKKVKEVVLKIRTVFNSGYKKMFWNKKVYR